MPLRAKEETSVRHTFCETFSLFFISIFLVHFVAKTLTIQFPPIRALFKWFQNWLLSIRLRWRAVSCFALSLQFLSTERAFSRAKQCPSECKLVFCKFTTTTTTSTSPAFLIGLSVYGKMYTLQNKTKTHKTISGSLACLSCHFLRFFCILQLIVFRTTVGTDVSLAVGEE